MKEKKTTQRNKTIHFLKTSILNLFMVFLSHDSIPSFSRYSITYSYLKKKPLVFSQKTCIRSCSSSNMFRYGKCRFPNILVSKSYKYYHRNSYYSDTDSQCPTLYQEIIRYSVNSEMHKAIQQRAKKNPQNIFVQNSLQMFASHHQQCTRPSCEQP